MLIRLIALCFSIFSSLVIVLTTTAVSAEGIPNNSSSDISTSPVFQVATIKPSNPEAERTMQIRGNRFATTHTSVIDLLTYAYKLQEQEIIGGPQWMRTQEFDILADPETQARPSSDEYKKMVQILLADRFHLKIHNEMKELSVYEIVAARGGSKLTPTTRPSSGMPAVGYSPGYLSAANATVTDLANFLQRFSSDRPVLDRTRISGRYDMAVHWKYDELNAEKGVPGTQENDPLSSLFTAIQEQLGLRLQAARRPIPVVVIDQIEMPTLN